MGNPAPAIGGSLLALASRALAVRPGHKPLHPRGVVREGRVDRHGSNESTDVPWLDRSGEDAVRVRLSRAVGLPAPWPDIHGLALRLHGADGPGDILFASTRWGRLGRFVLSASRDPHGRPLTTLLPYRTATGAIVLGARAVGEDTYELSWARPSGEWTAFAELRLVDESHGPGQSADDEPISFDPVRNQVPGLQQYPAFIQLREPSYAQARRSRS